MERDIVVEKRQGQALVEVYPGFVLSKMRPMPAFFCSADVWFSSSMLCGGLPWGVFIPLQRSLVRQPICKPPRKSPSIEARLLTCLAPGQHPSAVCPGESSMP